MKLFEINDAIRQVADRENIDEQILKDTLDSLETTREEKLDGIAGLIERDTADIEFLKNKIRQLTDQKRHFENQKASLQKYMTEVIDDAGYKQIKTKNYILKPRNFKQKTVISDDKKIPEVYKVLKEEVKIDKKKLYSDMSNGIEVPGAHLEPNRRTVIN